MKNSTSRSKRLFTSCELEKQLSKYVLAAAAGSAILATSPTADAEIVYTPANQSFGPNSVTKIDVNNDGVADFALKDIFFQGSFESAWGRLYAGPIGKNNQVWGHTAYRGGYVSALLPGAPIFPKGQFLVGGGLMAEVSHAAGVRPFNTYTCTAPWANVTHRYIGLKFVISGEVHFGWARVDVSCSYNASTVRGTLTGYAYETEANKLIRAGKERGSADEDDSSQLQEETPPAVPASGSLGRLAQGAGGIAAWRHPH